MLTSKLPFLNDPEGDGLPQGLPRVIDAHVQCFDMNQKEMTPLYEVCARERKPMILHVGQEPKSDHYRCDPYEICRADKFEAVLYAFPSLNICVPHLGFDEILAYRTLIEKYDNLWLDTAMVLTDYFPKGNRVGLETYRMDRIMYGSDFPNIPYAWDRELVWLKNSSLSRLELEQVLCRNATAFFGLVQNSSDGFGQGLLYDGLH